jgi:sulfite dehydrogenase
MGNARWKGVRLRDVLDRAGLRAGSVQVRFGGADGPVVSTTPPFRKALDVDLARTDDVLVAYEMNGAPLPLLNGYPLRLVVPGYFATYWVKMLDTIEVLAKTDDNFWMKTAYRIPATADGGVTPGATGFATKPIGKLTVRSFVTSVANGATIAPGLQLVRGIAFDGGSGVSEVDFSADGGATWRRALLGTDYGRYSFRRWTASFQADRGARYTLLCRATAANGDTQIATPVWNPAGYLRSSIERVEVRA